MNLKMKITSGLLGIFSLFMASAANSATISLNPSAISVTEGDTFLVDVVFTDFTPFFSGGIVVDWSGPPAVGITLINEATLAGQIEAAGFDIGFAQLGQSGPNTLDISMTGLIFDPTFINGTLLTLEFLADTASAGIADLTARNLDPFIDNLASPLDPAPGFVGASITVNAVPVPAAVWLFGSGLIGMVAVARRRKPQLV